MDPLIEILGSARMQELVEEAQHSSFYGVRVADMTSRERLATIGYLVEHMENSTQYLKGIKEQVEKLGS